MASSSSSGPVWHRCGWRQRLVKRMPAGAGDGAGDGEGPALEGLVAEAARRCARRRPHARARAPPSPIGGATACGAAKTGSAAAADGPDAAAPPRAAAAPSAPLPRGSVDRARRHGLVVPAEAGSALRAVSDRLAATEQRARSMRALHTREHRHSHTASRHGREPGFTSTHRTFLVQHELPDVRHNRRSEYGEMSASLAAMEHTLDPVHERSRRRNAEVGVPGDVRSTLELRRAIGTSLEGQLRVFHSLLQRDHERYRGRGSSVPVYFGYLPAALRPLS